MIKVGRVKTMICPSKITKYFPTWKIVDQRDTRVLVTISFLMFKKNEYFRTVGDFIDINDSVSLFDALCFIFLNVYQEYINKCNQKKYMDCGM